MELTPGTYRAKANKTGSGLGYTSKNTEQLAVPFSITSPGLEGQSITWYGYFTEGTIDRTIESLRICGWSGTELDDLSGIDTNEVELVLEEEEYNGKISLKVRWINRIGGMSLKAPLTASSAKAFAQRMKGAVIAFDQKQGTPKPQAAAVKQDNNDIPF